MLEYDIPKNEAQCRAKLREEFEKQRHVKDVRVIDMLVIKGQMELVETVKRFKQKVRFVMHSLIIKNMSTVSLFEMFQSQLMNYFKTSFNPKPTDFLSKFFANSP